MLQAFEWHTPGGSRHWRWLTSQLDQLVDMGITAIWVPPPTKASSDMSTGYDAYDLWDLGEFEKQEGQKATRWGTKEELQELLDAAKKIGIVVYIDAVLNHKASADRAETFKAMEVDQSDRTKTITEPYDIEGWTGFDFKARGDKYSSLRYTFDHFTGVDFDNKTGKNAIFQIVGDNKHWSNSVDTEQGNDDYLMAADVDTAHPDVKADLLKWGEWIVEMGFGGFRFDAARHVSRNFLHDFLENARKKSGKPLFGVGEFFREEVDTLTAYLDAFGAQFSLMDVCLHANFHEAGERSRDYDLRKIFDGTLVQKRPTDAVTFVDNHDTQPGQTCESWVSPPFKPLCYALILLRNEGYPCLFGGDLWGVCDDKGETAEKSMSQLADFTRARRDFSYGETRDYWDHPNCIGWVRMGDENHDGCAVVLCNGDQEGTKHMEVGKDRAGEIWTDYLGWHQGEVKIAEDGWGDFSAPASSVSIWVKKDAKARQQ